MTNEEFESFKSKALEQLKSGKSLTGKDGVFAPLLKNFIDAALESEMSGHLDEAQRARGNKRNGKKSKRIKSSAGELEITTPACALSPPKAFPIRCIRMYTTLHKSPDLL